MKHLYLCDTTLKDSVKDGESIYSFKETVEIARVLDKLNTDVIRLSPLTKLRRDTLAVHTMASVVKNSLLSMPTGFSSESVDQAWEAVKLANKSELYVGVPTSSVCLEYQCKKKPKQALEMIKELVSQAKTHTNNVNFGAEDATRADRDFLSLAIKTALEAGADTVTLCDTAGAMLPSDFAELARSVKEELPSDVKLFVQCSDNASLATASLLSALFFGVDGAVVTVSENGSAPHITDAVKAISAAQDKLDASLSLKTTELGRSLRRLGFLYGIKQDEDSVVYGENSDISLDEKDDIQAVTQEIARLGYDLSDDDISKVYEAFISVAKKKSVGVKELEAIIATVALQVPPTYILESYTINSGNHITATACVKLTAGEETLMGVKAGDGPIDAAFAAVDELVGRKYELDDFQIQSITEGSTALGTALVKLRAGGKLYSGNGVSTDIIGASLRAYLSAVNKIAYEEKN